jgi:hypothetical protein
MALNTMPMLFTEILVTILSLSLSSLSLSLPLTHIVVDSVMVKFGTADIAESMRLGKEAADLVLLLLLY